MKKLLEYYDIADLSNMSKKAGVRGSKALTSSMRHPN